VSRRFAACVDPRHGGEIFSLVDLEAGRQVLAGPPFSPQDPDPAALGFEPWVSAYRGGWQFVGPNVGAPCIVDGEEHAFHGRASTAPWEIVSAGTKEAVLAWRGHGIALRRRIVVDDEGVHIELEAGAIDRPVPLLVAEHLAFGVELLDPEVTIDVAASSAYEWGSDGPLAMADLEVGRARISNPARGVGYELTWDNTDWLRHVWLWREEHGAGGPWRGRASLLVVEPASIPHDRGLEHALEAGEARLLETGEAATYRVSLCAVEG
jgi:hypothetical protein